MNEPTNQDREQAYIAQRKSAEATWHAMNNMGPYPGGIIWFQNHSAAWSSRARQLLGIEEREYHAQIDANQLRKFFDI